MSKYTDEQLIAIIQEFHNRHNAVPHNDSLTVSKEVFRRRFGSFSKALELAGLSPNRRHLDQLVYKCKNCSEEFRRRTKRQLYCSHSCAAVITNTERERTYNPDWNKRLTPCVVCGTKHTGRVYCSNTCKSKHVMNRFLNGDISCRSTIRKMLTQLRGAKCQKCGISTWQGVDISLEVDHTNGDASNNLPDNVCLLCPNCHSVTDSWKGRNKGSGRKSRGLPIN